MKYAAGIDIGGTNTKLGIVDNSGNIIDKKSFSTKDFTTPHLFKVMIKETLKVMCKNHKIKLKGIGIGSPNANAYTGSIEYPPNLPWKGIINLSDELSELAPVKVTNDAKAAALGEKYFGNAKEFSDFIFITLGTGIGGGIFCASKLLLGKHGFAGEIGHTIAVPNGRQCNCGRKGCIEKYGSAGGIVKTAIELLEQEQGDSKLKGYDYHHTLSSKIISEAAYTGDLLAIKTFDITAKYLAAFANNLLNIFSCQALIFAGGVTRSGKILFEPLEKYFREDMLTIYKEKDIKILKSSLPEQDAAIIGAASLVL